MRVLDEEHASFTSRAHHLDEFFMFLDPQALGAERWQIRSWCSVIAKIFDDEYVHELTSRAKSGL